MAVQWHRSSSYETALDCDDFCNAANQKLCPSVTTVCHGLKPKSNSVRITQEAAEIDIWKPCTSEILLEFVDLSYKVKLNRNGECAIL